MRVWGLWRQPLAVHTPESVQNRPWHHAAWSQALSTGQQGKCRGVWAAGPAGGQALSLSHGGQWA